MMTYETAPGHNFTYATVAGAYGADAQASAGAGAAQGAGLD